MLVAVETAAGEVAEQIALGVVGVTSLLVLAFVVWVVTKL
jgi:ABC-type tungstate transport system substrate-binding protein